MSSLVIVGAQWGDEGKGKIVDLLSADADAVVRFGGGANAGHTLVVGGEKVVFHLMPSGALHENPRCILGPGTVLAPQVLAEEIEAMRARGKLTEGRVLISEAAHLVLDHHVLVDGLREQGAHAIGTTKRGIGPCYEDRAARRGIRVGDLRDPDVVRAKMERSVTAWRPTIEALGGEVSDAAKAAEELLEKAKAFTEFIADTTSALHAIREGGGRILLEGAQGTMLDIDHGTYPFVTSSSVTAGGACTGSGLGPRHIDHVVGITKAYTTRVGDGPFPTELHGEAGEALRAAGHEFGATTGRPRRCGWLDMPVLRHAIHVNSIDSLALTKMDVLSELKEIEIAVAYQVGDETLQTPPAQGLADVVPVYETLPGWKRDIRKCRRIDELPEKALAYVRRVEELAGIPVSILSVGPDREETIRLIDPWR